MHNLFNCGNVRVCSTMITQWHVAEVHEWLTRELKIIPHSTRAYIMVQSLYVKLCF